MTVKKFDQEEIVEIMTVSSTSKVGHTDVPAIGTTHSSKESATTTRQPMQSQHSASIAICISLPKVTILKFDGDYLTWGQFNDLFTEMIHKQQLPNAQKMWYLKGSLSGEEKGLVRHLSITNENYQAAWNLLQERYHNKRIIVATIIQRILSQPTISTTPSEDIRRNKNTT
ncbi:uncharacterized protein LOC119665037 [Teleopsis dalmanni]|uniref:uncharacterized protein LOC119665037 n=1 Tax=Teleopsis dalmanni TaxID=139649 RepID=UPI0018CF03C2|nr:uncharacterized protein LOC119665037 [Teleopsis dalmanni]